MRQPDRSASAQQRRAEIANLLARAVLRLHRRAAFQNRSINSPRARIGLDSSAEMPLSVARDHHNG